MQVDIKDQMMLLNFLFFPFDFGSSSFILIPFLDGFSHSGCKMVVEGDVFPLCISKYSKQRPEDSLQISPSHMCTLTTLAKEM